MTDPQFVIHPDNITRELEVGGVSNSEERDLLGYAVQLGSRVPIDTGLMPPNVLSLRQAGDHLQMVLQFEPAVNLVNWGEREGGHAEVYELAQPFRVIVGDFISGELLGARMFYSPIPMGSIDQPLYHQNLPNINCVGYNGTSVGWVCLYHRESWAERSIGSKAIRLAERCSGVEAYNNANMRSTDGVRFYQNRKKPNYVWSPAAWEKKSQKEGFAWTTDPDLWIPIKVKGIDDQDAHTDSGVPFTLRMAMYGNAHCYYRDQNLPKLSNAIAREDLSADTKQIHGKIFMDAFVRTAAGKSSGTVKANVAAKIPTIKKDVFCAECEKKITKWKLIGNALVCEKCVQEKYLHCVKCETLKPKGSFITPIGSEESFCPDCVLTCPNCSAAHALQAAFLAGGCVCCIATAPCGVCEKVFPEPQLHDIFIPADEEYVTLCFGCLHGHRICDGCGALVSEEIVEELEDKFACIACTLWCKSCESPFLESPHPDLCVDCAPGLNTEVATIAG